MKQCTTHHYACDCREAKFKELEEKLKKRDEEIDLLHQSLEDVHDCCGCNYTTSAFYKRAEKLRKEREAE